MTYVQYEAGHSGVEGIAFRGTLLVPLRYEHDIRAWLFEHTLIMRAEFYQLLWSKR